MKSDVTSSMGWRCSCDWLRPSTTGRVVMSKATMRASGIGPPSSGSALDAVFSVVILRWKCSQILGTGRWSCFTLLGTGAATLGC